MKKKIIAGLFAIMFCLLWFDLFYVDAQIIAKQVPDIGVNPQKAIISAAAAAIIGITIFLSRHYGRLKKKIKNQVKR